MDRERERDGSFSSVVDWSSSPSFELWDRPVAESPEPPQVELVAEVEAPEVLEPDAPAPARRPASPAEREELPPADLMAGAEAHKEAAAPTKGPGRSPLGILAFLALSGYLIWVSALCYQDLAALHAQAATAAEGELATLQQSHAVVTNLLLLNGAAAAPFVLAALLGLAGKRRTSQFFAMLGIAAVIFLLSWTLGEGRELLRETDVLVKTILIAVAAWFA